MEEVLSRQTEDVQIFLLRTSILEKLCGELCDALTGRTENQQLSINFTTGILGAPQVVAAQINLADENLASF